MDSNPVNTDVQVIEKHPLRPSLLLLLAISFFLFTGSFVLEQAFRWSDPWAGIAAGVCYIFFSGLVWLIFVMLPSYFIDALYRRYRWRRERRWVILFPGIAVLAVIVFGLIFHPTTPSSRLKKLTGADFPTAAQEVRVHFVGGCFADYGDIYSFRCTRAETESLIQALKLEPIDGDWPFGRPDSSWPDPSTWSGGTLYAGGTENEIWSYVLFTDAAHEQVYLRISCI